MTERADEPESLGKRMHALRGEARLEAIGDVVAQWRASGQSQAAFCREVGIAPVTLGRWRRQVESARSSRSRPPVFTELDSREVAMSDGAFEVVLVDGTWLRVPTSFRDGDLTRLLGVLSSTC